MSVDLTVPKFLEQAKSMLAEPYKDEYHIRAHIQEMENKRARKHRPIYSIGSAEPAYPMMRAVSEVVIPPAVFARIWATTAVGHAPNDLCAEGTPNAQGTVNMELTLMYEGKKYRVAPYHGITKICLR